MFYLHFFLFSAKFRLNFICITRKMKELCSKGIVNFSKAQVLHKTYGRLVAFQGVGFDSLYLFAEKFIEILHRFVAKQSALIFRNKLKLLYHQKLTSCVVHHKSREIGAVMDENYLPRRFFQRG